MDVCGLCNPSSTADGGLAGFLAFIGHHGQNGSACARSPRAVPGVPQAAVAPTWNETQRLSRVLCSAPRGCVRPDVCVCPGPARSNARNRISSARMCCASPGPVRALCPIAGCADPGIAPFRHPTGFPDCRPQHGSPHGASGRRRERRGGRFPLRERPGPSPSLFPHSPTNAERPRPCGAALHCTQPTAGAPLRRRAGRDLMPIRCRCHRHVSRRPSTPSGGCPTQ